MNPYEKHAYDSTMKETKEGVMPPVMGYFLVLSEAILELADKAGIANTARFQSLKGFCRAIDERIRERKEVQRNEY